LESLKKKLAFFVFLHTIYKDPRFLKLSKIIPMKKFFKESYNELQKVTWPTKDHAIAITILTIVFTAIATFFLTVVDGSFKEFYNFLLDSSSKTEFELPEFDTSSIKLTDSEGNEIDSSMINFEPVEVDQTVEAPVEEATQ